MVSATFSCDAARIFPTGEHHWHGRFLAGGIVGSSGDALLSDLFATTLLAVFLGRAINHRLPEMVSKVYLCRTGWHWRIAVVSGNDFGRL